MGKKQFRGACRILFSPDMLILCLTAPPELPYKSRTITDSRLEEDMPEHTDAVRRKLQTGKRMMEERRQLAEDGVAIWTCRMDYDTGKHMYPIHMLYNLSLVNSRNCVLREQRTQD